MVSLDKPRAKRRVGPAAIAGAAIVIVAIIAGLVFYLVTGKDDADSKYCNDLKSASKQFESLSSSDLDQLDEAFKTFHKLAAESPGEIESDWKVLDDGITKVEKALDEAGLKFSDFAEIQQGKMPEGVDVAKLQGLAAEFQTLSSSKFEKASNDIEKHAKDTCKVDLNA